jgi:solute carrier family 26 protein
VFSSLAGHLPTGLPGPELPKFELLPDVFGGAAVIAIVAYTTSYSMAKILALKQNYQVDANQELLAQGLGNLTGSCFKSAPIAAALSRSLIQQTVGGATQVASFVSCGVLLVILLFLAPLLEPLPHASEIQFFPV